MKQIPMVDLLDQYSTIQEDIDTAIANVIKKTAFVGGEYVEKLEKAIALFCESPYAVGLNSGTDALYLGLKSLGVKAGDEVITTPFTFFATAEMIAALGATPVFIDIHPDTFTIDETKIEEKITKKTKVIIPVHLFGQPANMTSINQIAKKHNIAILEDACQAIGSTWKGKKVGNLGNVAAFSFYPSKNLGAWGDGGMITTKSKRMAKEIRLLRNHGSAKKYYNDSIGVSSRLDGIQAAILLAKLKHLDEWNKSRQNVANQYNMRLTNLPSVILPKINKNAVHVFHQYTLRVPAKLRNPLQNHLAKKGIATMIYYPIPLHLLKALRYLGHSKGDFPETEKASKEVLSLPIYPELTTEEIDYICQAIRSYV